ncbi:hypothetical protein KC19_7G041000 [Ceratodon purpureus]|uniref:Uncharacterized protein n=1 Tax=Ceratodon purpureus TaxID=3225 RepID=A0A8T0H4E9_CERPU|nr:hypothetical protein KC19_7G041000 [Ceratodon purpureus]
MHFESRAVNLESLTRCLSCGICMNLTAFASQCNILLQGLLLSYKLLCVFILVESTKFQSILSSVKRCCGVFLSLSAGVNRAPDPQEPRTRAVVETTLLALRKSPQPTPACQYILVSKSCPVLELFFFFTECQPS